MGWTYTHRGDTSVKDFLADRVNCENDHAKWLLLDIAIVKMRTAYLAVEIIRRDKVSGQLDMTTRRVVAFVFLLDYRSSEPGYDIGYKDMDESMGPCESECPERILRLLTPTSHEYALAWRKRCREIIAERKSLKLKKDEYIKTKPISFRDGQTRSCFQVFSLKPLQLLCLDTQMICRVPRAMLRSMILPQGLDHNQASEVAA